MRVTPTAIADVLLIEPDVHGDSRGYFQELFQDRRYREAGIDAPFVQDNVSLSEKGVLRGLHYQNPRPQGKLVYVLRGEVYDIAVDMRRDSPTFGRWVGEYLSEENHRQLWVPPGFAHGFCVTSDVALFAYKCTEYYSPADEHTVIWNDPDLDIRWPLPEPRVSAKDAAGLPFARAATFPG